MILKMRSFDEGWYYYQVPKNIKHRVLTDKQWECLLEIDNPTAHCNVDIDARKRGRNKITVICIDSSAVIYTNLMTYLLNDEGKTIDTLVK